MAFPLRSADRQDRAGNVLLLVIVTKEVVEVARRHPMERSVAELEALVEESNARWMKNEQVIDDTTIAVAFLSADLVAAAATNAK